MHILCLDIPAPSASLEKYAPHLTAEALHTWGLYKPGFIRNIHFYQNRPCIAILQHGKEYSGHSVCSSPDVVGHMINR